MDVAPQPVAFRVTREYRALPKTAVQHDAQGRPFIDCPNCGKKLIVLQHPSTCDGRPFVQCDADCPDQEPIIFVDGIP